MKKLSCDLTKIIGITLAIFSLCYIRKYISGKTLFISNGIKVDYHFINLENREVTAYISFKGKTCMRIQYNVLTNKTKVNGSIETIKLNRILKRSEKLNDAELIEMVQDSARFFIENEITNPNEYYGSN